MKENEDMESRDTLRMISNEKAQYNISPRISNEDQFVTMPLQDHSFSKIESTLLSR
jgi:hypothetical protein